MPHLNPRVCLRATARRAAWGLRGAESAPRLPSAALLIADRRVGVVCSPSPWAINNPGARRFPTKHHRQLLPPDLSLRSHGCNVEVRRRPPSEPPRRWADRSHKSGRIPTRYGWRRDDEGATARGAGTLVPSKARGTMLMHHHLISHKLITSTSTRNHYNTNPHLPTHPLQRKEQS